MNLDPKAMMAFITQLQAASTVMQHPEQAAKELAKQTEFEQKVKQHQLSRLTSLAQAINCNMRGPDFLFEEHGLNAVKAGFVYHAVVACALVREHFKARSRSESMRARANDLEQNRQYRGGLERTLLELPNAEEACRTEDALADMFGALAISHELDANRAYAQLDPERISMNEEYWAGRLSKDFDLSEEAYDNYLDQKEVWYQKRRAEQKDATKKSTRAYYLAAEAIQKPAEDPNDELPTNL
jgi:hypothetical protein